MWIFVVFPKQVTLIIIFYCSPHPTDWWSNLIINFQGWNQINFTLISFALAHIFQKIMASLWISVSMLKWQLWFRFFFFFFFFFFCFFNHFLFLSGHWSQNWTGSSLFNFDDKMVWFNRSFTSHLTNHPSGTRLYELSTQWESKEVALLHIDSWLSRQSEVLFTGCICENKRKQSHGWMEMCGRYEMIFADAYLKVLVWSKSQLADRRALVSANKWLGALPRQHPPEQLRRSYGSIWQSAFISLCLHLSLTHPQKLWSLLRNKVWELYIFITSVIIPSFIIFLLI